MKNLGISDGCKIWNFEVKDIELTETFKCTGQELYNALTQKEMLQIFTGGEVKVIIILKYFKDRNYRTSPSIQFSSTVFY